MWFCISGPHFTASRAGRGWFPGTAAGKGGAWQRGPNPPRESGPEAARDAGAFQARDRVSARDPPDRARRAAATLSMLRLVHSWTHSSFLQTLPQQPDRAKNTRFDTVDRNAEHIGDLGVRPLLDHGQPERDPEFRGQFIEG